LTDDSTYYWAGGQRIPLAASGEVLVDLGVVHDAGISDAVVQHIRDSGRRLTDTLTLLSADALPEELTRRGPSPSGVHPVFLATDGTLVAALPEVRVESHDPERLDQVRRMIDDDALSATIKSEGKGRMVLEPTSGRGADALSLANKLSEGVRLDVAQARFLRVIPRPDQAT
jgi:hypothetical protein